MSVTRTEQSGRHLVDALVRQVGGTLARATGRDGTTFRVRPPASILAVSLGYVPVAEHAAQGAPITLTGEDVQDAVVAGDAVALRRVVANLTGNAVKFGRSAFSVAVERSGSTSRVVVGDDGPGIPASERTAVFSPFYRIECSRNRETGGTGLGLAIARQIAEAHGGTVKAKATALGGARLGLTLPAIA